MDLKCRLLSKMVRCILYTHKLPDKAHPPPQAADSGQKQPALYSGAKKMVWKPIHTKTHTHQEENLNKQLHGETVQAAYSMAGL